jgi:hypothetical protein
MNILKINNGKVELRKDNGSFIRSIGIGDATSAKFSGKDILVTTSKGKTELRKESGAFIRII